MYGNVSSRTLSDRRDDYLYRTERSDGCVNHLTDSLLAHGVEMFRFKMLPARIDKRSIDFSKMEEQRETKSRSVFSFTTNPKDVQIDQASCWLTYE